MSMKITAANQYLDYATDATKTDQYARLYLYATAFPSFDVWLQNGNHNSIKILTTGHPQTLGGTFSNAIALNKWIRFDTHLQFPGSGQTVGLFNAPDSVTPTETSTGGMTSQEQLFRAGCGFGGPWGSDFWIDNLVCNADTDPGPWTSAPEPVVSAVTYTVRDYFGNIVSAGEFDESQYWFLPTPPAGGWSPGWYRVYLTGPQTDANFSDSYGVTNFCVIRDDAHFVSMPAGNVVGGYNGESPDLVMKGVLGLGTSRLIISDCASPSVDIATAQAELAITETYWTNTGIPDTQRTTREPWCTFPNCDGSPTQLSGVTSTVAALYPDCKYFEGPSNEPNLNNVATVTAMQNFQAAVHAGNASAKAIGPCPVNISDLSGWTTFLNAGGGDYCDEFSFHAYNAITNGDMNLGVSTIRSFKALLASYGYSSKGLWQTESVGAMNAVYGVYHPRRSRVALISTLVFEQLGVPRERDNWWYDVSHGFWSVPNWIENGDGSLEPHAVLGRVLAEETWGKPFASTVDLGFPGNRMFIMSLYAGTTGSVIVIQPTSFMDGASVTLSVYGASSVTVVDGFGNATVTPLVQGRVQIPLTDTPAYVQLPVGAQAGVYRINDWLPVGIGGSVSPTASTKQIDGVSYPVIADDAYMTNYGDGTGIAPSTWATPPSITRVLWGSSRTIQRIIVWAGPSWQNSGTLISFDVQTTTDGVNWTTRQVVNRPVLSYFYFGSDGTTEASFVETYWDEQWIFDVAFPTPVACTGVRLNVSSASYGGEPLSSPTFGQGNSNQGYRIEEIGIYGPVSSAVSSIMRVGKGSAW